jgi:hypothetical protein
LFLSSRSGIFFNNFYYPVNPVTMPGENLSTFWALGGTWGTVDISAEKTEIRLLHGKFYLKEFKSGFKACSYRLNGKKVSLPVELETNDRTWKIEPFEAYDRIPGHTHQKFIFPFDK